VFAIVTDLLLADGKIDARERRVLRRLAVNVDIRTRVAGEIHRRWSRLNGRSSLLSVTMY